MLGSRQAIVVVNNADEYCGVVPLPELFSGELDSIAEEIQVVELVRYADITLLPDMVRGLLFLGACGGRSPALRPDGTAEQVTG